MEDSIRGVVTWWPDGVATISQSDIQIFLHRDQWALCGCYRVYVALTGRLPHAPHNSQIHSMARIHKGGLFQIRIFFL